MIEVEYEGDCAVIHLSGEIDIVSVTPARDTVEALQSLGQACVRFDLTGVTFIDSQGFNLFAVANNRAKAMGGRVQVTGTSHNMRRLFELSGMDWLLVPQQPDDSAA